MSRLFEFIGNHPLLFLTFGLLFGIFVWNEIKRTGKSISPSELVRLMNQENAVIVDLRDTAEYENGHVTAALNIPYSSLQSRMMELEKFKQRPVVMTCKMGTQSGQAGTVMKKAGFANVMKLKGGMMEWQRENLPLVRG